MSAAKDLKLGEKLSLWWGEARANPKFRLGLAVAVAVAALDQLSKYLIVHVVQLPEKGKIEISGIFDLSYVENIGASFGMLAGMRWALSLLSIGVAFGLAFWLGRQKKLLPVVAIGLIIGGALGNLYDRLAYGYVVDFLDFSGLMFPWVFNVADASINIGVALLLIDAFLGRERPAGPGAAEK